MGVSTVEAHLSHVYRKLGVRRAELAGRLAVAQGLPAKTRGRRSPNLGFPGFRAATLEPYRGRMVYVVERYLPGLNRSELLRGLLRLEQGSEKTEHRTEVRYLDSTIVLRDEACFCRFEGPSSDAVAEVNRQAGLPFDRIVPAVTVHPKGAEMSTYPSIPATVEIKRGRLVGLVVGIAALTAAVTWVLSAYAFDSGGSTTTAATAPAVQGYMSVPRPAPGYGDRRASLSRATCPIWASVPAWTRLGLRRSCP